MITVRYRDDDSQTSRIATFSTIGAAINWTIRYIRASTRWQASAVIEIPGKEPLVYRNVGGRCAPVTC